MASIGRKVPFPPPKPKGVGYSSDKWDDNATFVLEHLFGIECFSALRIDITADSIATVFFNDKYICKAYGCMTVHMC